VERDTLIPSSLGPIASLESLDPEGKSLWIVTKREMIFRSPSPPLVTQHSVKPDALTDMQEAEFQPVTYS
jgi:hypothetical protein